MADPDDVERGRQAFVDRRWDEAFERLTAADAATGLAPDDLERLAAAAYLLGDDSAAVAAWTRAHQAYIEDDRALQATRPGFFLSLTLLLAGEPARSAGWLERIRRLASDSGLACAEQGYPLVIEGLFAMSGGDAGTAEDRFAATTEIARRFADADLLALGLLGQGQVRAQSGKAMESRAFLDEAMVGVTAGEVSSVLAGVIYCAVIRTCQRLFDVDRAREWTRDLDAWCGTQPDMVAFRGDCLIHRAEILQLQGDWPAALEEAESAGAYFAGRSATSLGRALYQCAEVHRLRGEREDAARLYEEARGCGFEPQPGRALLHLAEGDAATAETGITSALDMAGGRQGPAAGTSRARLLAPFVEIKLVAGDTSAARRAADELAGLADALGAPFLVAASAQATGHVLLVEGDLNSALERLREAWIAWQDLDIHYEAARVRVLIGRVFEARGDRDTARLHFEAASAVFARLGAAADLEALAKASAGSGERAFGLTGRERQVLAEVAAGATNREIAAVLAISEHTVARHISNIFDKLGVSSRTAASTVAHRHNLV